MLSLSNNISATQVVEAKYSASFGGTDDFIDFGNVNNLGTGDFSFSFWVKASDTTTNFLFSKREDGSNYYYIRFQGSNKIQFRVLVGGSEIMNLVCTTAVNAGEFNHVVISCDRSESSTGLKYFLNGNAINSGAASATNIDNTGDFHVGRFGSDYAEDGTILDEIGVFNVALDVDNASAIYNNGSPLNLKFDQGNYNNSSALQAYYRMGDGFFDDKANGVVHDQDNPGFGGDLITNGDFSNGLTGWNTFNATLVNAAVKLDNTSNAENAFVATDSAVGTVGDVYKLIYDVTITNGKTLTIEGTTTNDDLETDTVGVNRVKYFVFNKSSGKLVVKRKTSGTNVTIDNLRLFKLNGKPGITSGGVTFSSDTP